MSPQFRTLGLAAVALAVLGLSFAAPSLARQAAAPATAAAAAPPSAEDFGREAAIKNVSLSPDGKHIAAIVSPDGKEAQIAIWSTDAMDKPPVRLGCGERSTCMSVRFVKNDRISVQVRQLLSIMFADDEGEAAGMRRIHAFRFFTTDLEGKEWRTADGDTDQTDFASAAVVDTLPRDPKNILVIVFERRGSNGTSITDGGLYKLNVYTGAKQRLYQGSDAYFDTQLDLDKQIRGRKSLEFENGNAYFVQWIRDVKSGAWTEHFRWYPKDREEMSIIGFTNNPNIAYVLSNKGRDTAAIYEYDIAARKLGEIVFETRAFDAADVITSGAAANEGAVIGFRYAADTSKVYWVDGQLDAMEKGARKALGVTNLPVSWINIATGEKTRFNSTDGVDARLSDWSDDRRFAIVTKSGPRQPAQYYLLTDGTKLTLLGETRPWLKTETLGDTRLIQYPARDGLMIPGFLTTPRKEIYGPGPYPTIILPHGGPWARDYLEWDGPGWTQYFAARGYAVLQPQYRGSEGWGQRLWRAGDAQWGMKMQDDKDDGAKWLIAQGIAAPDRIAMHGYSYGGYAAMVAAIRPNGIYQCAVAGAGVASLEKFRTRALANRIQREYQRPSLAGLSPVDHIPEVSIPIFLYHGDRDTNVDPDESERFVAGLKSGGKLYKFVTMKDMGHESNKWGPGQIAEVLTAIEAYLRTDCGPGGL